MAGTPKPIDTGADQGRVFQQQVGGPSVASEMLSPSVAGAAYEGMGRIGEQLSDVGQKLLLPEMADKGAAAVSRDPETGELSVSMRTPLNDLDVAYNHAAQGAFLVQSEGDRRSSLQQLAIDNIDDPDKFRDLATKYVKTQAGGTGVPTGLRGDLLNTGMQDVVQLTDNLVQKKQTRDTKNQLDTINLGVKNTSNDIYALAHQGGTATPDFQAAVGKLQNQLNMLGGNPLFGMSPAEIEGKKSEILSNAEGEATLGHALAEAKSGGTDAGIAFLQKSVWDPQLNLTPAQRESFEHRGTAEIHELEATQRVVQTQLKQQVVQRLDDALSKAKATGRWDDVVTPNEIASAYKDDPAKASDIMSALNGAATTFSMHKQVAQATPADLAAMEKKFNPANNTAPSGGYDSFYREFLAPHEVGFSAHDGSPDAGPVNGGVNQDANPDLDVKNLTPTEQKQVLHDRYWVASGADALPPQLAAVVGDTAVNMGVARSKELLAQSGGDANKFLDLRAAAYKSIAAANPAKAGNLPDWLTRNEDLRNYISGGGFADKEKTYTAFLQAVHERSEQLNKDPAGYVVSARGDVANLLQSNDATTFQTGVRNSLQVQRDLGVNAPKVLSSGQASALVQQFNNPQNPDKRADNMLQIIGGMEQRYGQYFPQAMTELHKAGLPVEAVALAQVKDDPAVRGRMAMAVNAGRETLKKAVGETTDIDKSLQGALGNFNKTLIGYPDGAKISATQAQAVQLYAYQLSLEGEKNPGPRAVQDIIGKHYTFADTYRVPTGVDPDLVGTGASTIRGALRPEALAVPPGGTFAPGTTDQTKRDLTSKILKSQGVWVTLPDDSGLALRWPQSAGFAAARDSHGKPITYNWAQLRAASPRSDVKLPAPL